ncbi:MAG: tRNA (5-methylaminomethyl-2-thiouridylate)-methyltransferase, partial [Proteobacteria bacterium]|nr:tRNA (5-methylaminomethyl-2-thiouridylate)-methyltransferase [Pseudomonadota bacterium]
KLADLWQARGERRYEIDDIMLLKVGRHIRPRPHFKLMIGRDDGENNFLKGYRKRYQHMHASSHRGPLVLIDGDPNEDDLQLAARLTARFGKGRMDDEVTVTLHDLSDQTTEYKVAPFPPDDIPQEWYL